MQKPKNVPVLTLDGPSGSGKGTVARGVAAELGFGLLDSGALYRAVALMSINTGTPEDDERALVVLVIGASIDFCCDNTGKQVVLLDGQDVTLDLRKEEIGNRASRIATHPAVRQALLERQRMCRKPPGLVADGRDLGSVVFPDAVLKIFLTATATVRAERRSKQLLLRGVKVNYEALLRDIHARDRRDLTRRISPLKAAENAINIDSSSYTIEQVVNQIIELARCRLSEDQNSIGG